MSADERTGAVEAAGAAGGMRTRVGARHWLALAVGLAAVSWAAPLVRLAAGPSIVVAALRLTFAAAPTLALVAWRRRDELRTLDARDAATLAVAGLALAGHFGFWFASVQRTSVLASVALVTTYPLFVALGGRWLLGERASRLLWLVFAVALAGTLVIASGDRGGGSLAGALYALTGSLFAAVYFLAGRRARQRLSNLSYLALVNGVAAVALLAATAVSGHGLGGLARDSYLYALLLALVPQLIGHGAFTWALGALPAVVVVAPILGERAGATALSAIVLDEVPTLRQWLGSAVVLAGVALALRGAGRVEALAVTAAAALAPGRGGER